MFSLFSSSYTCRRSSDYAETLIWLWQATREWQLEKATGTHVAIIAGSIQSEQTEKNPPRINLINTPYPTRQYPFYYFIIICSTLYPSSQLYVNGSARILFFFFPYLERPWFSVSFQHLCAGLQHLTEKVRYSSILETHKQTIFKLGVCKR